MEDHKRMKPFFSQAADRLNDRIMQLLGDNEAALDVTSSTRLGKMTINTVDESREFPKLGKNAEHLSVTRNSNGSETHDYGKRVQSQESENTGEYYSRVRAVNLSHSPVLDGDKPTPQPKDREYDSSTSPLRSSYNRRKQLVSQPPYLSNSHSSNRRSRPTTPP